MINRLPLKYVSLCVSLLFSLALSLPAADELSIGAAECTGQTVTSGSASVTCPVVLNALNSGSYSASGNLSTGTFATGASTSVASGCLAAPPIGGCGFSLSTVITVSYNFGELGVSSGTAQFKFTANGTLSGSGPSNIPIDEAELFEANVPESLSVNGGLPTTNADLPSGISQITVSTPITNGTATLQFTLLAAAVTGADGGKSVVNFNPISITGASAYDANGNLVPGVTFVSDSGFNPNVQAAYSCQGFQAPFTAPISINHKTQRAIPLVAQLLDPNGNLVTPTTLGTAQAPVVNVNYSGSSGTGVDVTNDLDPAGQSSSGNTFHFDATSNTWWFNLGTGSFTASGTYIVALQSGNVTQYSVSPQCSGTFVRE